MHLLLLVCAVAIIIRPDVSLQAFNPTVIIGIISFAIESCFRRCLSHGVGNSTEGIIMEESNEDDDYSDATDSDSAKSEEEKQDDYHDFHNSSDETTGSRRIKLEQSLEPANRIRRERTVEEDYVPERSVVPPNLKSEWMPQSPPRRARTFGPPTPLKSINRKTLGLRFASLPVTTQPIQMPPSLENRRRPPGRAAIYKQLPIRWNSPPYLPPLLPTPACSEKSYSDGTFTIVNTPEVEQKLLFHDMPLFPRTTRQLNLKEDGVSCPISPMIKAGDLVLRRRPERYIIRNTCDEDDIYDGPFIVGSISPQPSRPSASAINESFHHNKFLDLLTSAESPKIVLQLPTASAVPTIVPLSELKPYHGVFTKSDLISAMDECRGRDNLYIVNMVKGEQVIEKRQRIVLVSWLGYGSEDDTWEPEECIPVEFIEDFRIRQKKWDMKRNGVKEEHMKTVAKMEKGYGNWL